MTSNDCLQPNNLASLSGPVPFRLSSAALQGSLCKNENRNKGTSKTFRKKPMRVSKLLSNVGLEKGKGYFQAARRKESTGFPEVLGTCTDFDWNHTWLESLRLSRAVVPVPCEVQWVVGNSHVFV